MFLLWLHLYSNLGIDKGVGWLGVTITELNDAQHVVLFWDYSLSVSWDALNLILKVKILREMGSVLRFNRQQQNGS